jgi:NAD+ kinase
MKRFLLIANSRREEAPVAMKKMADWLIGKAEVLGCITDKDAEIVSYNADFIITFGGDGTILNVARKLSGTNTPVFGVNLGRLGYLAEVNLENMFVGVENILEGGFEISQRMMLKSSVSCGGDGNKEYYALNDVLISSSGRIVELEVEIGGRPVTSFRGDGVIISTPTGSTAHSMSAGGPIVSPGIRAIVFTPICPHELANRPLVVSDTETFKVKVRPCVSPVRIAIDGQEHSCLPDCAEVHVTAATERHFNLVQMKNIGRYDILRQKLGWGGRDR